VIIIKVQEKLSTASKNISRLLHHTHLKSEFKPCHTFKSITLQYSNQHCKTTEKDNLRISYLDQKLE